MAKTAAPALVAQWQLMKMAAMAAGENERNNGENQRKDGETQRRHQRGIWPAHAWRNISANGASAASNKPGSASAGGMAAWLSA
jgi:hypothetical protein